MKNNRKGFTTVELVIVIAVIAILAAVLIPTFSNLITKANQSAALQEVRSAYGSYVADFNYNGDDELVEHLYVAYDGYWIKCDNGNCSVVTTEPTGIPEYTLNNGVLTATNAETPIEYCACADGEQADANKDNTCDKCSKPIENAD